MKIKGKLVRSLTPVAEELAIDIIDQTALPHAYRLLRLRSLDGSAHFPGHRVGLGCRPSAKDRQVDFGGVGKQGR